MESLGYTPSKSYPESWLKPETRQEGKVQYYSYLLCYVDDILCINHNADSVVSQLLWASLLKDTYQAL